MTKSELLIRIGKCEGALQALRELVSVEDFTQDWIATESWIACWAIRVQDLHGALRSHYKAPDELVKA